tara:strand:+ start:586 stop:1248 length:663 start_codon:yes stop_codon:yes gene_type:complete
MLSNYRSAHEPAAAVSTHQIMLHESGCRSDAHFGRFLNLRDRFLNLEFEASHFLVYACKLLPRLFPQAKFIFTIRDPLSWILSERNQNRSTLRSNGLWREYELFRYDGTKPWDRQKTINNDIFTVEQYIIYWKFHCSSVLDSIPRDQLLIVPTRKIDTMLGEITDFVEIPVSSIQRSNAHRSNKQKSYSQEKDCVDERVVKDSCQAFIESRLSEFADDLL